MSGGIGSDKQYEILYSGKPSEVTESQAKEWVEGDDIGYKHYSDDLQICWHALDSFKSALTGKDWIIITKKKIL